MGGKPTPGVGWAAGIERLSLLVGYVPSPVRPVAVISIGDEAEQHATLLMRRLRYAGFRVDSAFSGTVKKRMKRANAVQARVALLLGEDELAQGVVTVHDLDSGEPHRVPFADVQEVLLGFYADDSEVGIRFGVRAWSEEIILALRSGCCFVGILFFGFHTERLLSPLGETSQDYDCYR